MVVVEVARGLDGKKRTRSRTADMKKKRGTALVIMAKMLQKPT